MELGGADTERIDRANAEPQIGINDIERDGLSDTTARTCAIFHATTAGTIDTPEFEQLSVDRLNSYYFHLGGSLHFELSRPVGRSDARRT